MGRDGSTMMKAVYILFFSLAAAVPSLAWAQAAKPADKPAVVADKGVVTKAQQLRMRMQLMSLNDDQSMAARMNSGLDWSKLSPDQQEKIREEALAFMGKSEAEQAKLLAHYQRLMRLDAPRRDAYLARAAWLRVVVDSFTPAERQSLEALTPQDRAARLIERKDQLVREGKLPISH